MTRLGPAGAARAVLEALEAGREAAVALRTGEGEAAGSRIVWTGAETLGKLGSAGLDAAARSLVESGAPTGLHSPTDLSHQDPGAGLYLERFRPAGELVIVGAGHIARPLATLGALLDLRVTVVDDRPDFATEERFPEADRVLRVDFADPFREVRLGPGTHLVLVTRGHRYDFECLRRVLRADPPVGYLGMIGSRRRVRATFEALRREGFAAGTLARVHAPVGLDVGAETPEEIAVAVAAEMVLHRRGGSGRPLRRVERVAERFFGADPGEESPTPTGTEGSRRTHLGGPEDLRLLRAVAEARRDGPEPPALATVVDTRGSTPRKEGSRMLLLPGETLVGTIGGGCGEAEVIRVAREVRASGRPRTVTVDLTEDLLSWSPAVCGGVLRVFVEPVDG